MREQQTTRQRHKGLAMTSGLAVMTLCLALAGCAGGSSMHAPTPLPDRQTQAPYVAGLERAAQDIQDAIRVLAETQNAQTLMQIDPRNLDRVIWQSNYTPPGMEVKLSVDWVGPIKPVVDMVAEATGYDKRIIGKPPIPDYFVRISHQQTPAIDVLRDLGTQIGPVAELAVFPATKLIELRYFVDQAQNQKR